MQQDQCNSSVPCHMIPAFRYCIDVQDWNSGTWAPFFRSHSLACAVSMLLYLDRRLPENLNLRREFYYQSGSHLLN